MSTCKPSLTPALMYERFCGGEAGSLRASGAGNHTRQQRNPHLPDVLRQAIFDKVLILMLVLADVYQVVVFAWSVTDGMKVQDHPATHVTARLPEHL